MPRLPHELGTTPSYLERRKQEAQVQPYLSDRVPGGKTSDHNTIALTREQLAFLLAAHQGQQGNQHHTAAARGSNRQRVVKKAQQKIYGPIDPKVVAPSASSSGSDSSGYRSGQDGNKMPPIRDRRGPVRDTATSAFPPDKRRPAFENNNDEKDYYFPWGAGYSRVAPHKSGYSDPFRSHSSSEELRRPDRDYYSLPTPGSSRSMPAELPGEGYRTITPFRRRRVEQSHRHQQQRTENLPNSTSLSETQTLSIPARGGQAAGWKYVGQEYTHNKLLDPERRRDKIPVKNTEKDPYYQMNKDSVESRRAQRQQELLEKQKKFIERRQRAQAVQGSGDLAATSKPQPTRLQPAQEQPTRETRQLPAVKKQHEEQVAGNDRAARDRQKRNGVRNEPANRASKSSQLSNTQDEPMESIGRVREETGQHQPRISRSLDRTRQSSKRSEDISDSYYL